MIQTIQTKKIYKKITGRKKKTIIKPEQTIELMVQNIDNKNKKYKIQKYNCSGH